VVADILRGGGSGADDVGYFEDGFGVAVAGDVDHGAGEFFSGGDVFRECGFQEREDRVEGGVEELVELCLGTDAVKGLHEYSEEDAGPSWRGVMGVSQFPNRL
jgi:hypothetical protein